MPDGAQGWEPFPARTEPMDTPRTRSLTVSYIQEVLETVERRNPGEPEFLQAVREVLDTLEPVM